MENLSTEQKQQALAALADEVDSLNFFDWQVSEHFCLLCTAGTPSSMDSDQACPINDYQGCNELLFDIGMELREQRGGSLSLVCFRTGEPKVTPLRQSNLDRSNAFVWWLLRTYVCTNGLKLQRKWVTVHTRIIQKLPDNSRLTRLELECPRGDSVQADFAALWITNFLLAAISALLRNTACLTFLVFRVCLVKDQSPQTFINALAANTTLKYLELWVNWNIPKTRERVGASLSTRVNRWLNNRDERTPTRQRTCEQTGRTAGAVGGASAVTELNLTNCVDVNILRLLPLITECKQLHRLRCAACAIPSSDVVRRVVQQLPYLVEVEFFCLGERDSWEAEINPIILSGNLRNGGASNLRLVYCEVGQDHNFARLHALMEHSPNGAHLYVQLLRGDFRNAVRECHTLIATCTWLETFTFTSEVSSPFQSEPVVPLFFAKFAAVCANIRYRWSNYFWSCFRLQDLVVDSVERRRMPFQTVLVAGQDKKTPDRIR
ncbi:hypothetical protein HPB51_015633 [Rhipicephalus microplus]|uniref:Uncharacterized protein n=1 Tax=Rhipicephalus microplus TaxID=6941 RepID=A0A9J6DAB7_RHIMP|nr:hypothetical protein HPB51_015633 [Rhipicephalus microplus]